MPLTIIFNSLSLSLTHICVRICLSIWVSLFLLVCSISLSLVIYICLSFSLSLSFLCLSLTLFVSFPLLVSFLYFHLSFLFLLFALLCLEANLPTHCFMRFTLNINKVFLTDLQMHNLLRDGLLSFLSSQRWSRFKGTK